MAHDVDDLDRGLVHALQVDGRATFRAIGDVLGCSDRTVARRYSRLVATRGLRVVATGLGSAGSQAAWIVRVRVAPSAAGEVADALARRPDTSWISLCSGGGDIVATVGDVGVQSLLLDVLPRTRHVVDVQAYEVLRVFCGGAERPFDKGGPLRLDQVTRLNSVADACAPVTPTPRRFAQLDQVDRQILSALERDGRVGVEDLASMTGVSPTTARRRIAELRRDGSLRFTVDVDLDFFGLPVRAMVWMPVDADRVDEVGTTLASHDEVAFAAATTGTSSVFASVSTRDAAHLYRLLTGKFAALPGVGRLEATPVLRHVKSAVSRHSRYQQGFRQP